MFLSHIPKYRYSHSLFPSEHGLGSWRRIGRPLLAPKKELNSRFCSCIYFSDE